MQAMSEVLDMISQATLRATLGSKYMLLGAFIITAVGMLMCDQSLTVAGLILMLVAVTSRLPSTVFPKNRADAERMTDEFDTTSQTQVRAILGSRYTLLGAFIISVMGMFIRDQSLTIGGLILMLFAVTSRLPLNVFPKHRSDS
jgi:hypothetical protein